MSLAGLINGFDIHYLDHLGPLCSLLKTPLIVNNEQTEELAIGYYPELEVKYVPFNTYPKYILSHFNKIISCLTKPYLDVLFFFSERQSQHLKRIWCPHGQSDKPFSADFLKEETALLVYGPMMKNYLPNYPLIQVGNYRNQYFQKHILFYEKYLKKLREKFQKKQPIVFYAPTWEDYKKSSSLPFALETLLKNFPDDLNLLIKLHPNTLLKQDLNRDLLKVRYEIKPNIVFLDYFPSINLLIELADIYIGDFSSIGYDFLRLKKPRYFLVKEKSKTPLFSCGKMILETALKDLFTIIEQPFDNSMYEKGFDLYQLSFQPEDRWIEKIWNV